MCCDQNSHCIPPVDFTNSCAERTHTPPPQTPLTQAQLKLSQRVTGESSYSSPGRNLNVCKVSFCVHRSSMLSHVVETACEQKSSKYGEGSP